jgi:hypothetical protein
VVVRAVDSAGFTKTATWTYQVVNRPVLTVGGADGAVLPDTIRVPSGSVLNFDAEVSTDEPTNKIRSVQLYVDGQLGADPAACPGPTYCPGGVVVRKVWPVNYQPGTHELRFVAQDQWGIQAVTTIRAEVYPGTRILPGYGCCEVSLGKTAKLTGRLLRNDTDLGEAGRKISVQWRPTGATSWQSLASLTTSSAGRFAMRHAPHRNGTYRLSYAGIPGTLGSSVGTLGAIVHPRVKGNFRHHGVVRRDHVARVDVHTSKADAGSILYLQRYNEKHGRWVTLARRHIPATRHLTFAVHPHRHGAFLYQVVRPATVGYGDAADDFALFVD